MQQEPKSATENGIAVENPCRAAPAHANGIATREWDEPARDCSAMGVSLSTVNRAHMAYDHGGIKALKRKPIGGRTRENMTAAEEKALVARFAKTAGAKGNELEFEGNTATNAEGERRNQGGKNRHHARDGIAVA